MVFVFEFVYIVNYIDEFSYIKPYLHPWDEAYWIMMNDRFDVFLDSVCKNFIEYFCIDIHKRNWSEVNPQIVVYVAVDNPKKTTQFGSVRQKLLRMLVKKVR